MKLVVRQSICAILVCFFTHSSAMEVFEAAAEKGLGEGVAKNLEEGALKSAAESIAEKMGIAEVEGSIEQAIKELPDSTREAFQEELTAFFENEGRQLFREGEFVGIREEILPSIGRTKENFLGKITNEIGPQRGFSGMERDALAKFGLEPGELEKFPVQTKTELENFKLNTGEDFTPTKEPVTGTQQELKSAEQKLAEAHRDLSYAGTSNKAKLGEAKANFEKAEAEYKNALKEHQASLKESVETAKGNVTKQETALDESLSKGGKSEIGENRAKLKDTEAEFDQAKQKEVLEKRKSALREYEDAQGNKKIAEKGVKDAKAELQQAQKELAEAKASGNEENVKSAEKKVAAKEQALKDAEETNRISEEDFKFAENRLIESGEGSKLFKAKQLGLKTVKMIGEQMIVGVLGGFAFSIPNFPLGAIETAMAAKSERETLMLPQRFGTMWLQIPIKLISEATEPVVAKYVYVAIDAPGSQTTVERSAVADTDSFLSKANYFIARSEYDEYASAPIPDPRFPGTMVHANTGFNFNNDGRGIPGEEVIQFLGEPPQSFRGKILQYHLNEEAADIERGYSGREYFEYREETTGYEGSKAIADFLDDKPNTKDAQSRFSGLAKENESYGKVLAGAIGAFASGEYVDDLKVIAFKGLSQATITKIGGSAAVPDKPYGAFGTFVYQTADTPTIKNVRALLMQDPALASIANDIVEYVLMLDDNGVIVSLQTPQQRGDFNYPTYVRNPKATKMLSLLDGSMYIDGRKQPSGIDVEKLIAGYFPAGASQIQAVHAFIKSQLQYGPFSFGDVSLVIDRDLAEENVPVYKISKFLEGGFDDYVVATQGMQSVNLPGSPTNFVSLVTSRIYDSNFVPYDKEHGNRKDLPYTVYRPEGEEGDPRVFTGSPQEKYGDAISQGLQAPLFNLYMDPDINPNEIGEQYIQGRENQEWLAEKLGRIQNGAIQWPLYPPVRVQWALNALVAPEKEGEDAERISDLLAKKSSLPAVKKLMEAIQNSYTNWKKYYATLDQKAIDRELGIFPWGSDGTRPINIRATSAQDVKNGNFVYTSPFYPDEYLVMSDDAKGTIRFATEYDPSSPQRYVVSLTSGKVYDRNQQGEMIDRIANLDDLIRRVTSTQGVFLAPLQKRINDAKIIHTQTLQQEQYGPATAFGPFQFYLFKDDLLRGQFIYADATNVQDPLKKNEKELMQEFTDFYVAVSLIEGVKDQPEKGGANPALNPANWLFGTQLGADTYRVLSLVAGTMYDRGGTYQGYFKEFAQSIEKNIDVQKGFINLIEGYLKKTWQLEEKPTEMRSELKARIFALTQEEYEKLLKEKKQIEDALRKEEALYAPLDKNLIANINSQSYIKSLLRLSPPRYIKKYQDKYYYVSPDEKNMPKVYIDYNVGPAGKDNRIGMSYDSEGKAVALLAGWALDNVRAHAGIVVSANGVQELDITMDHPFIPVDNMVLLDSASLKERVAKTNAELLSATMQLAKNPTNEALRKQGLAAAAAVGFATQAYESSLAVQDIVQASKGAITFYFNKDIAAYFCKTGNRYIDLIGGVQYELDGKPRLDRTSVLVLQNAKEKSYIIEGEGWDSNNNVFIKKILFNGGSGNKYESWDLVGEAKDEVKGSNYIKYTYTNIMFGNTCYVYHDKVKNEYKVYVIDYGKEEEEIEPEEIGIFKPDSTLRASLLSYYGTAIEKGKPDYKESDELLNNPTYVLWDGGENLNFTQVLYQGYLVDLKTSGASAFTAQIPANGGKARTLTLTKVTKDHGGMVQSHYMTIADQPNTYYFLYNLSILDPELPVTCSADELEREKEIERLNYWKRCAWKINAVRDAYGVSRIVKELSSARLPNPPQSEVDAILKQAGNRANIVQDAIKLISYDPQSSRYFYKLTNARDAGWAYFQEKLNNWYVDLATGILFSPDTPTVGYYPVVALLPSQLYILLDRLEVSVAPVKSPTGTTIYGNNGNQIIDPATGKPLLAKPGLIYRSTSTIKEQVKKIGG